MVRFNIQLSLIILTYFLILFVSNSNQNEFNLANVCPTSRRLLLFNGLQFPLGKKKSDDQSSSSSVTQSKKNHGETRLTVYFQPQTSAELGKRIRSYSHLLKKKIYTKYERNQLKKEKEKEKKKKKPNKSSKKLVESVTRDLVPVDKTERDRCRALLDSEAQQLLPSIQEKETKPSKSKKDPEQSKASKENSKKESESSKSSKEKSTKESQPKKTAKESSNKKSEPKKATNGKSAKENEAAKAEKEKPVKESEPVKAAKEKPVKESEPVKPSKEKSTKEIETVQSKKEKNKSNEEKRNPTSSSSVKDSPPIVETEDSPNSEDFDEQTAKNDSVVGRAYYFVRNMFQLSDDNLESNSTSDDDSTNEQHRQSRKLLSVDGSSIVINEFARTVLPTRHLLSVKNEKKRSSSTANKPKVGWTYRYRISRYLDEQKSKKNSRARGGGKDASAKKSFSKRKLLQIDSDEENCQGKMKNDEQEKSASFLRAFVPKRQLLASNKNKKNKVAQRIESDSDDETNEEKEKKHSERQRIKSYEELTDPVAIVESYDQGLFKPRVGWQFRYRVSRYIDSLRDNIREDQERLKLGLAAIKRKTPQELSGRRKRVLDKPFTPEPETVEPQENKPNVGWRYRYRISKMMEAKARGEYIDDEEEKRKARLDQKKRTDRATADDDDDCLEWENDLDPELRKINDEGRRVGWAYRYRIRRKLDHLKQQQAETGMIFDLETLNPGGKREKVAPASKPVAETTDHAKPEETNKKAVGWKYRYRVSKMREAQQHEEAEQRLKGPSRDGAAKNRENLDPELANLTPEQRVVGWAYRYRIRRKLDAIKIAERESQAGSRLGGKDSKRKRKEKIIQQVEESIEKILNIDDIDETPFMEYFRRTSSYVFSGLVPTAKKSICLLPLPVNFEFCLEEETVEEEKPKEKPSVTETATNSVPLKKERTKKEKVQPSSTTRTKEIPVKTINEKQTKKTIPQTVRSPPSNKKRTINEKVKHFDEEEEPIRKRVGVESSKRKTKKQYQIIGQEVRVKKSSPVENSTEEKNTKLKETKPVSDNTTPSPPATEPPTTTTTPPPPPPPPPRTTTTTIATTTTTTSLPPLSEIDHKEAATVLTAPPIQVEDVDVEEEDDEDDDDDTSTDSEKTDDDDEDDEDDEETSSEEPEDKKENFDPLALKKLKKYYENAKASVQDVFDVKEEQNSA